MLSRLTVGKQVIQCFHQRIGYNNNQISKQLFSKRSYHKNRLLQSEAEGGSNSTNTKTTGTSGRESHRPAGPVTYTSLAITGIVGAALMSYYQIEKENRRQAQSGKVIEVAGKPALGGPWVLVDQDGIPRTNASYFGQYVLLYFGFTHCPDICPSELVKVGKILDKLDQENIHVKPIFVSVDPARDCLAQLKHYASDFNKNFVFLTGTNEQVAEAARHYRVYFSKANEDENDEEEYLVDHSIVFYFLSPQGEFVDFFTQKTQVNDVVQKIKEYVTKDKVVGTTGKK